MTLNLLEKLRTRPVLADGALGSMFYARGVFINRCYDELSLSDPDLVRTLHEEYLLAGAEVIETNTFGANRERLRRFRLEAEVAEMNRAAARLAREAVDAARTRHNHQALVAGSIGPIGGSDPQAAEAAYREQLTALAPGVDLLVVETATHIHEAATAVRLARQLAQGKPVVAMITVTETGNMADGTEPEQAARVLEEAGAHVVGCNCSEGPRRVLETVERMRRATHLPLAAMPNAGVPSSVDGRSIYLSSPEYLGSFARKAVRAGASLIGGCCGTTPQHIRAMRQSLKAVQAQADALAQAPPAPDLAGVEPLPLAARSQLGRKLAEGRFVTLVEIVPPRGIDAARELAGAAEMHRLGVDAINVPDSPRASARMSAASLCLQIQQQTGTETVLHFTCRDRNLLGIQGDLLGGSSLGLRNVLCLTGDPPKLANGSGEVPDATAVFDLDAVGLIRFAAGLNRGIDLAGESVGQSTGFVLGCAANPGVPDIDAEIRRFAAKVEAGAEFCITQPVFNLDLLEQFLRRIEGFRIPVVAGIWPLTSARNAEFMRDDLKVSMPDGILRRMQAAPSPEHARAEGVRIAQEMLQTARGWVQGVQVSAPFGRYTLAAEVLSSLPGHARPQAGTEIGENA